jgi:serine/threonine protein kinase
MPQYAASALLQAGIRQRLFDVKQALEMRHTLLGCGDDPVALDQVLAGNTSPPVQTLRTLLPAIDLPTIEPYRRLARLGEGRLGITWLGLGNRGLVALKEFHQRLLPQSAEADRLCADLAPFIGGGHRYLVNYIAVARSSAGGVVLVQEYRQGRDLNQRAAAKVRSSEARVLVIMRQAAKGLAVLHHLGHCHGHLHPGNILLDADGHAALGDYGLAWNLAAQRQRPGWDAVSLQRQAWAAPEELSVSPQSGLAADIYALGCIGYWMLSGSPPFPGEPDRQTLQHLNASRPDVRNLAEDISEITAKTLLKTMLQDPKRRYHDARSLVHSLERDLDQLNLSPKVQEKITQKSEQLDLGDGYEPPPDEDEKGGDSSLHLLEPV